MQTDIREAKAALRRQIGAALAAMPPEKRAADSARICAGLRGLPVWKNARSILLFAPMPGEPDVWPLLAEALAAGKTVALPRFNAAARSYGAAQVLDLRSNVVAGHFGIREPAARCPEIPLNQFELVLVPGVAFDRQGRRLGRGSGYYDRLLAEVRGIKCGVAFDEQMVVAVPAGPSDVRLDFVMTPAGGVEIKIEGGDGLRGCCWFIMGMVPSQFCGVFHGRSDSFSGSSTAQPLAPDEHEAQQQQHRAIWRPGVSRQVAGCAGVTSSPSITSPSFQPGIMLAMLRSFRCCGR